MCVLFGLFRPELTEGLNNKPFLKAIKILITDKIKINMKCTLLLFATLLLLGIQTFAQTGVAINTTGNEPDTSAMLDVSTTEKGLLIPRMTEAQRTAIALPAKGLLVYQNDGTEGFYYFDGSVWTNLSMVNFSESNFLYGSKYGVKLLARNVAQTDVDIVLSPKGNGGILAQQPDGTATGGNIRGQKAVDLQMQRTVASQVASGQYATAIGNANTASQASSTAIGSQNTASQLSSTAMGSQNTASNAGSTAIGWLNTASGRFATAMGYYSFATGEHSAAIGYANTASGNKSVALGSNNAAQSFGETVLGVFANIGEGEPSFSVPTDRLFAIGNGELSGRSDALLILKNANTTIGGSLTLNGNGTGTSFALPLTRGTNGQVLQTDGSGNTSWGSMVGSQWTTNGSNVYYNSGNVGIGTADPTQKLTVEGSVLIPSGQSFWIGNASGNGNRLRLHHNNLNAYIDWGEEALYFRSGAASTNRVVFTGDGQVVIPALNTTGVLLNNASGAISSSVGTSGQVLTTNGSGGISWATLPAAPVTSVAGKTGAVSLVKGDVGLGNVENTALSTWAGSINMTTLGTISTGTWNGTTISLAKGGTGATTKTAAFDALSPMTTQGDIVYGGANGTGTRLAKGTAGQVLTMNVGAIAPQWTTPTNGTVTSVTGTAPISVATGTTTPAIAISAATTSAAGSMSAADKDKLDGSTHAIGDSYGGGIVFYVYDGGRHGLVAVTTDQSNNIRWYGGTNTNTRARADGVGAGLKNTAIIIANQGPVDGNSFAATLCNEYSVTVNGVTYGDWYLPSKHELSLLYLQKTVVGNFTTGTYWSSTEFSSTEVWVHVFFNGEQYESDKFYIISARAIRAF